MEYEVKKGKIFFSFDSYDNPKFRQIVDRCRFLGMTWSRKYRHWSVKDSYMMRRAFLGTFFPDDKPPSINERRPLFPDPPDFLMAHQSDALWWCQNHPRWLFAHDTGTGKTVTGIEIHRLLRLRTLVVCPLSVIEDAWEKDIKQFAPDIAYTNLWEAWGQTRSNRAKFQKILDSTTLGLVNFESFKSMRKYLDDSDINVLLVDESSKMKSPTTAITKSIIEFADNLPYAYLFSGTAAPNHKMEYWSQARVVDPMIWGGNFYHFRGRYFYNGTTAYDKFKWFEKFETRDKLMADIASFSTVVHKADVLDLPGRTFNIRKVTLSAAERQAYDEMEKHLILELEGDTVVAQSAAVKYMKLRQITAGFIYSEDQRAPEIGKSKLNELAALLEEIGNHRVIIWTEFINEADRIEKMLGKCGRYDGTVKMAVKTASKNAFKAGDLQYLIAHPQSMGHGVDLPMCSYMAFATPGYSAELEKQARDRIYRKGQVNKCSYYYLLARNTIDIAAYRSVKEKRALSLEVENYVKARQKWAKL